jgi:hypothetical protein
MKCSKAIATAEQILVVRRLTRFVRRRRGGTLSTTSTSWSSSESMRISSSSRSESESGDGPPIRAPPPRCTHANELDGPAHALGRRPVLAPVQHGKDIAAGKMLAWATIVGDDAYSASSPQIVTPYPGKNLSEAEDATNYWISNSRIEVRTVHVETESGGGEREASELTVLKTQICSGRVRVRGDRPALADPRGATRDGLGQEHADLPCVLQAPQLLHPRA